MRQILTQIEDAVRECAEIIVNAKRNYEMVDEKSGRANFVTVYDKAVQDALQEKRAELYFELRLSPWDFAADSLIVTEAGGKVTQVDGKPITLGAPCSVIATNGR